MRQRFEWQGTTSAWQNVKCALCGEEAYGWHRDRTLGVWAPAVGLCVPCMHAHKEDVCEARERHVVYLIESGWENKPIWACQVQYVEPEGEVVHMHTTSRLGAAPSVLSQEVRGLEFEAKGIWWPIEAREGKLVVRTWDDGYAYPMFDRAISQEAAIEYLQKKGDA